MHVPALSLGRYLWKGHIRSTISDRNHFILYRYATATMSTQFDIVYKFKEALGTGNSRVVAPFVDDDLTHQVLPTQCVSLGAPASD